MNKKVTYAELMMIFAKIGAFTIGGGYAMIPLIENEIVTKRDWIDKKDFIDVIAVSQSSPGILAVNIAIFIGYKLKGIKGSISSTIGAALPPFVIILSIAMLFANFKENQTVERIFKGIRPAVVALIATPVFSLAKSANINLKNVWIPVLSTILIYLLGVSPVWIIMCAGVGGYLYGQITKAKEEDKR